MRETEETKYVESTMNDKSEIVKEKREKVTKWSEFRVKKNDW